MKRVTSKQKRVKELAGSSAHLVFNSEQHEEDRRAADRLRSMPEVPRVKWGPFPGGKEISFQGHFGEGGFETQDEENFIRENVRMKKECSWYLREDKRRPGGPGRKEKTGILEINVSLPVGIAKGFATACEISSSNCRAVQEILLEVGKAGMAKVEELTKGYKPVYIALHPDSEGVLSFHFGLSPVDPASRKLLGISADGKRGKKGLRLLGDAFMSILRHARYIKIPQRLMILPEKALREEGRSADWEIGLVMEEKALELAGRKWPKFQELVEKEGKVAAENWLQRLGGEDLVEKLQEAVVELGEKLDQVEGERDTLRKKLEILDRKLAEKSRVSRGPEMGAS